MGLALRLLIAVGLLLAGPASAQDLEKNPFRVEVTDLTLAPAPRGNVAVSVIVPREYHVYRDNDAREGARRPRLTVGEPTSRGATCPIRRTPRRRARCTTWTWSIDVAVPRRSKPGTYDLDLEVAYQAARRPLLAPAWRADVEGDGRRRSEGTAERRASVLGEARTAAPVSRDRRHGAGAVHVNRDFIAVSTDDGSPYTVGDLDMPAGVKFEDPAIGMTRMDLSGDSTIKAPITGRAGTSSCRYGLLQRARRRSARCRRLRVTVPSTWRRRRAGRLRSLRRDPDAGQHVRRPRAARHPAAARSASSARASS
jgi:hypothetical protein